MTRKKRGLGGHGVDVLLSTHDENKLTEKDIFLAKLMDNTFDKFK